MVVLWKVHKEHSEIFMKRSHRYCEVSSLSDLQTIVVVSLLISRSIVVQLNSSTRRPLRGIRAANSLIFIPACIGNTLK